MISFGAEDWMDGVYNVYLAVHPQDLDADADMEVIGETEGAAVGPGGTYVWGVVDSLLPTLEMRVRHMNRRVNWEFKDQHPTAILVVGAATPELFRIYERSLKRRGYVRVGGDMIKELKA